MLLGYLFALFGALAAKLWPLEVTILSGSSPGHCTLRIGVSGVEGWSSQGYFEVIWPGRAYPVLSDVTCHVLGRIAELLWRSDPNLSIQFRVACESANRDFMSEPAPTTSRLPPGDDPRSAPKRKQGPTAHSTKRQPRIRPQSGETSSHTPVQG